MENAGGVIGVGGDGWEMGEGRRRRQALSSKECYSDEKIFGVIEAPDRRESTP